MVFNTFMYVLVKFEFQVRETEIVQFVTALFFESE